MLMAVANALKLEGGTRETAAASALALLLAGADGQMKLQSTLNHGLPPPDTNTSIRFMTAGQSWIRYGICRTSRSLQHSVTRVSYGIELKNVWAYASTRPIATTVSSPRATRGKLLFIACGRSRRFARVRRRVQDMASFMRSHLLGSHGAMQGSHRNRSDAPVRNVQAHAGQQRTDPVLRTDAQLSSHLRCPNILFLTR